MFETHIYIETDSRSPKLTEKTYGYVLEVTMRGENKTREGFGKVAGTYNQVVLTAMVEALDRFNQNCEIHIHTEDDFVLNMMDRNLATWAENDFKTSKGKPVANEKEWRLLWEKKMQHLIVSEPGKHAYTGWLQREMERQGGQ